MSQPHILIQHATIHLGSLEEFSLLAAPHVEAVSNSFHTTNAFLNPDSERFVSTAPSGMVHDPLTGLDWSPDELEEADWDASTQACRDYRLGGYTDWRMPTDRELFTIVDRARYNPCLAPIFKTKGESVWTSMQTPWSKEKAGSSRSFFCVSMSLGLVLSYDANLRLRVRPVRRAVPASQ